MRGATISLRNTLDTMVFQSTLPMRGATSNNPNKTVTYEFQSTLPMRGATAEIAKMAMVNTISIHAPHAGSDKASEQRL